MIWFKGSTTTRGPKKTTLRHLFPTYNAIALLSFSNIMLRLQYSLPFCLETKPIFPIPTNHKNFPWIVHKFLQVNLVNWLNSKSQLVKKYGVNYLNIISMFLSVHERVSARTDAGGSGPGWGHSVPSTGRQLRSFFTRNSFDSSRQWFFSRPLTDRPLFRF